MEKRFFSLRLQEKLINENWIVEKGMFIKLKKDRFSLQSLNLIDENKDKLTSDYFAFLTHLYLDRDEKVKAVGGKFYNEYTDYRNLYLDKNINKPQIIRECIEAVLELQSIGVNYTDIHANNIIVNNESHMKLVDLDETKLVKICEDDKTPLFINLILQSMLFFDVRSSIWPWVKPKAVLLELENKKVLSSDFLDSISGKSDFNSFYSNVDNYLEELCDKEKSYTLRKELRNRYPKWF